MPNTINAGSYNRQLWESKLSERLNKPTAWRDVADVLMADIRLLNVSYMSTEFASQTGTRGTAYGSSDFTLTNETLTLSEQKLVPVFVDHADALQSDYVRQVEIATMQGNLLSEDIETAMLDDHNDWTNFGNEDLNRTSVDGTTKITVSSGNIDNIVREVRRKIIENNGLTFLNIKGLAFVWRALDLADLEAFAQANGFNLADAALKNGIPNAFEYLGTRHYVSNSHVATHVMACVRGIFRIGILKGTWTKIFEDPEAPDGNGPRSGIQYTARADFGTLTPTKHVELVIDVNVV